MKMSMQPELKVQLELDAHEKECAIRYQMVNDKLEGLDKRMWRIEAMSMVGTLGVVALVVAIVMKTPWSSPKRAGSLSTLPPTTG